MIKYANTVLDTHGNALSGVSIQVDVSTGGAATLFSDDGATSLANPITSEADGSFKFYAQNGIYTLTFTKSGYTFDSTDTSNITLYDPTDGLPSGAGTAGSVVFFGTGGVLSEDNTNFYFDDTNNQLKLAATGSSAGVLIGGDTQWYRSAANVLRTPDSVTIDTDLSVGGNVTSPVTFNGSVTHGTAVQAVPTGSAALFSLRAWANFNGTGTVAIRASGNVSSITDNGTGDYDVNFTTAMADTSYALSVDTGTDSGAAATGMWSTRIGDTYTTAAISVRTGRQDNGSMSDPTYVSVLVTR